MFFANDNQIIHFLLEQFNKNTRFIFSQILWTN